MTFKTGNLFYKLTNLRRYSLLECVLLKNRSVSKKMPKERVAVSATIKYIAQVARLQSFSIFLALRLLSLGRSQFASPEE